MRRNHLPRGYARAMAVLVVAGVCAAPAQSRLLQDSLLGLSEVVYHSEPAQVYLGSPSLLRTRNGSLLVSADRFGSGGWRAARETMAPAARHMPPMVRRRNSSRYCRRLLTLALRRCLLRGRGGSVVSNCRPRRQASSRSGTCRCTARTTTARRGGRLRGCRTSTGPTCLPSRRRVLGRRRAQAPTPRNGCSCWEPQATARAR